MSIHSIAELRALKTLREAPGPTYAPELTLADKHYNDEVADAYYEAMTGRGNFWRGDDEEYLAMFKALQEACALIAVSEADRWRYLMRTLSRLADNHAQDVAEMKVGHV